MSNAPPREFYYLAEAYFHQDFATLYGDIAELTEDVAEGFESFGSSTVLKRYLEDVVSRLSDPELSKLWTSTNAQVQLGSSAELRRVLKHIAAAL